MLTKAEHLGNIARDINLPDAAAKRLKRRIEMGGRLVPKKYDGRVGPKRARKDKQISTFYSNIDLPRFKTALEFAGDPRFKMLFLALSTPKMMNHSFAELCRRCKLTLKELTELWRDHNLHAGMIRMMGHLPEVMEDTIIDAKSRMVDCPDCQGKGKIEQERRGLPSMVICKSCYGDGRVRLIGDKGSRELVFESVGLKRGGMQITQNVNIGEPSHEDEVKELERVLDITPIIEVENGVPESIDSGS